MYPIERFLGTTNHGARFAKEAKSVLILSTSPTRACLLYAKEEYIIGWAPSND
ncbi:hypothetical protein LINPERHAP1_LOCUS24414 [Linum perenne]